MAMYKWLPDAEIPWRDVWHGALVTAGLFVLGKFLLVWVYYSAMIFFLGAEFTQAYADRRGRGIPDEDAVRSP